MAMPRQEERVKSPKVRWYFTKEELANSPSRREHGVEPDKELSYRQQAANMIQDMGQKLNVNQLCINTAIVYMHRFYVIHSFKTFHRHLVATSSVFLAAKSEEQPRKLQYVAQASYACVHKDKPMLDIQSEEYTKLVEEITYYELVLLETLGFEVKVDHPHPHVVKCMQFLKASKDLAQMAYFMAHNSLLLTTFCLEHSPSTVACVCIHLSCRWKGLDIPRSSDGKSWWEYIDPSINRIKLDELTKEFLMIYDKSPSRLQKKITEPIKMQGSSGASSSSTSGRSLAVLHSSEKGKHPSGAHGHMAKQQHQRPNPPPQPGSHGMKPHTQSTGDRDLKNHGRGPHAPHPQPQSSRGVKRHHTEAQSQGKKRVKTEHSNSQPPLPPAPSLPPLPPLPSGPPPPPNSISTLPSSHPPPPQHHHHRPHSKHRANSLAPPLPPPLPLSPSPPPPPPPR